MPPVSSELLSRWQPGATIIEMASGQVYVLGYGVDVAEKMSGWVVTLDLKRDDDFDLVASGTTRETALTAMVMAVRDWLDESRRTGLPPLAPDYPGEGEIRRVVSERLHAPWTPAQVQALNRYQQAGRMHPFTCGYSAEYEHPGGSTELVATIGGWICPYCEYEQDWAHPFMADPEYGRPWIATHDEPSAEALAEMPELTEAELAAMVPVDVVTSERLKRRIIARAQVAAWAEQVRINPHAIEQVLATMLGVCGVKVG